MRVAIAIVAVVGAATAFVTMVSRSGVVTADEADNGGHVLMYNGQVPMVNPESNASTAYCWEVATVDDSVLPEIDEYQAG